MAITLQEGDKAPAFKAKNERGAPITLTQFKGKKLALFFYPKDLTPGCTTEACNLRDNYKLFQKKGYEILGVSADSSIKHQKFIEKNALPFSLLVDEDHKICLAYGTWEEKQMFGKKYMGIVRTTFVINEKGRIEKIIKKVLTKDHSAQILSV